MNKQRPNKVFRLAVMAVIALGYRDGSHGNRATGLWTTS
jgi:hypothetical protein